MSGRHCEECGCLNTSDNPVCDVVDQKTGVIEFLCLICISEQSFYKEEEDGTFS
jgi:hypothetical protein